jgi:hypothetical protein
MPTIGGGDIGLLKWPDIRSLKHLLQLLDLINDAFNIHPAQYNEPAATRHSDRIFRQPDSRSATTAGSQVEWVAVFTPLKLREDISGKALELENDSSRKPETRRRGNTRYRA